MKRNRLLLSLLLAAALTLPLCLADEITEPAPTEAPVVEITPEPTVEPAPEASAQPEPTAEPVVSAQPTQEPETTPEPEVSAEPTATVEPTATPEPVVSAEPTTTPEPTVSVEPTVTPEPTISAEPTITPEPEASPSPTPTAPPEPGESGNLLAIAPEGNAQDVNGVWNIQLTGPDAPIAFAWTLAEGSTAQYYIVYTRSSEGVLTLLQGSLMETRIELAARDYMRGSHTLHVGVVLSDGSISWGHADFTLAGGGRPDFPGGMGSFGGAPFGGADMPGGDEGFRIVPGQALTNEHSSGSMNKTAYTDAAIDVSGERVSSLTLGLSQAEIALEGGTFHVQLEDGRLTLIPTDHGEKWQLSVLAMNILNGSGIERIVFQLENMHLSLPTRMELNGSIYGMLRASGLVDKDILLTVDESGVRASVNGCEYLLNDSGELVPLEG